MGFSGLFLALFVEEARSNQDRLKDIFGDRAE